MTESSPRRPSNATSFLSANATWERRWSVEPLHLFLDPMHLVLGELGLLRHLSLTRLHAG